MNCDRIPLVVAVVAANVARCKLQLYHDAAENAIATLHVMLPLPHAAAHAATRWNAAAADGKGGGGEEWVVRATNGRGRFIQLGKTQLWPKRFVSSLLIDFYVFVLSCVLLYSFQERWGGERGGKREREGERDNDR